MSFVTGLVSFYTDIGNVLSQWESLGVFSYVLPFLLIFAIVFAILDKIEIFKDKKGVNLIISLAVGLLALQLPFVSEFFSIIFPKLGIGLAVILVGLILFGIFLPNNDESKWFKRIFSILGGVIFLVVVIGSFSGNTFFDAWWWQEYYAAIIIGIVVVIAIIAVVASKRSDEVKLPKAQR